MAVIPPAAAFPSTQRSGPDGPLVTFFAIAYARAWGLWLVIAWAADQARNRH